MTYGYRLNVEHIFFRLGDVEYDKAKAGMGDVQDFAGTEVVTFRGPTENEAVASCVIAIVGWAVGVESVINLVWNHLVTPDIPKKLGPMLLKQLRTLEKLEYLVKEVPPREASKPEWFASVRELFELRNRFVHFKEEIVYQGFEYAPAVAKALNEKRLRELREAAGRAVSYLASMDDRFDARFLNGDYVVAYDEG